MKRFRLISTAIFVGTLLFTFSGIAQGRDESPIKEWRVRFGLRGLMETYKEMLHRKGGFKAKGFMRRLATFSALSGITCLTDHEARVVPFRGAQGGKVLFLKHGTADEAISLWRMNAGGGGEEKLLDFESNADGVLFFLSSIVLSPLSPDGKHILYPKVNINQADIEDSEIIVYFMNIETKEKKKIYRISEEEGFVERACWSPDGSEILFSLYDYDEEREEEREDIYILDTQTGEVTQITSDGRSGDPCFSPDGTQIVFEYEEEIYIMDKDGGNRTLLTEDGCDPTWAPDGEWIVFEKWVWEEGVYKIRPDGKDETKVLEEGEMELSMWSEDGTHILFANDEDEWVVGNVDTGDAWVLFSFLPAGCAISGSGCIYSNTLDVYSTPLTGLSPSKLTTNPKDVAGIVAPICDPGGKRALFMRIPAKGASTTWEPSFCSIELSNPNTHYEISRGLFDIEELVWSPDGERIAYEREYEDVDDDWKEEVWVVNWDGTGETKLCDGEDPNWSPDGTRIAFEGEFLNEHGWTEYGIGIIASDGTGEPRLIVSGGWNPMWRPVPDGWIAYEDHEWEEGTSYERIILVDPDNPDEKKVLVEYILHPDYEEVNLDLITWSRNGEWLLYTYGYETDEDDEWHAEVRIVRHDGSSDHLVLDQPFFFEEGLLSLSPDGSGLAFCKFEGDGISVYIVDTTTGENLTLVTPPGRTALGVSWINNDELLYSLDLDLHRGRAEAVGDPVLSITPVSLSFDALLGGENPAPQTIRVENAGGGVLSWSAKVEAEGGWLSIGPSSGTAPADVKVSCDITGLEAGDYEGKITFTAPGAFGSPKVVGVTLSIREEPGSISGTVTLPLYLEGLKVEVLDPDDEWQMKGSCDIPPLEGPNDYKILDLDPGTYKVRLRKEYSSLVIYYDKKGNFQDANTVRVNPGEDTPNINFSLELFSISGTVLDAPGGNAVVGLWIYAAGPSWVWDETDTSGKFTLENLLPGAYRILTWHWGKSIYYKDTEPFWTDDWDDATEVEVTSANVSLRTVFVVERDTEGPESCSVLINGGDSSTTSLGVELTLHAEDEKSGMQGFRVSNDGVNFSRMFSWRDEDGDNEMKFYWRLEDDVEGEKTVYVEFFDWEGNSSRAWDTINYEKIEEQDLVRNVGIDTEGGVTGTDEGDNIVVMPQGDPDSITIEITLQFDAKDAVLVYNNQEYPGAEQEIEDAKWLWTFEIPEGEIREGGQIIVKITTQDDKVLILIVGEVELIDPAGYVYNAINGERVPDAKVTLWYLNPLTAGFEVLDTETVTVSPPINPQYTNEEGYYGWMTPPGEYYVEVEASWYESRKSRTVKVPPEVTDLHVTLTPLDTDPPEVTIKIDGDAPSTWNRSVTLDITFLDTESGEKRLLLSISNDPHFPDPVWEDVTGKTKITKSWILSEGKGEKSVYVRVKDYCGNVGIGSDNIWYGEASQSDLSGAYPYPNPWKPGSGDGGFDTEEITFTNLSKGAVITIYTLSGELVAEIENRYEDGEEVWKPDQDLASGLYIYHIHDPGVQKPKLGKLAIIK